MRSAVRSIARRRVPLSGLFVVVMAALACWGPEAPAPAVRQPSVAESEEIGRLGREIFALVLDNKDRCLRVAREARRRYEIYKSPMNFEPIHQFLKHDAKPEEAAVAKASDIASRLLNSLYQMKFSEATETAEALDHLLRAQKNLCQQTYSSVGFGSNYEQRISLAMIDVVKYEQALDRRVPVSDEQRRAIREQYRMQLAEARQAVLDEYAALGQAAEWKFDPVESDLAPELAREREESWRKQQAWLEEQRRQQDVLHREAVEQWRGREPRAAPQGGSRLGLVPTTEVGPDGGAPPSAMKAWHGDYTVRAMPAKIALDRLLQVREDVTAPRAARACQSLYGKASDLLVGSGTFESPEPAAGRALKEAFTLFRQAAEACMNGEQKETDRLLQEGQAALDRAAAALSPYSLAP